MNPTNGNGRMVQNFEIGDKVKIYGDDRIHTIKEIAVTKLPIGWHAIVKMEDCCIGIVDSSGFTDMTKI
jgi:hypothetical protein